MSDQHLWLKIIEWAVGIITALLSVLFGWLLTRIRKLETGQKTLEKSVDQKVNQAWLEGRFKSHEETAEKLVNQKIDAEVRPIMIKLKELENKQNQNSDMLIKIGDSVHGIQTDMAVFLEKIANMKDKK